MKKNLNKNNLKKKLLIYKININILN